MLSILKPTAVATVSLLAITATSALAQEAPVFRRGEAVPPAPTTLPAMIPVVEAEGTVNADGVYVPPSRSAVQTGPIPVVTSDPVKMPSTIIQSGDQPAMQSGIQPGSPISITPITTQPMANQSIGQPISEADAYAKITELEAEIRSLTGQLEQQNFTIRQLQEQVEKLEAAKAEAVTTKAAEEQLATDAPTTSESEAILTEGSAKERYEQAIRFIQAGQYATAETALQQFLVDHRDHVLAGNAQYWLGESYYVRQQYANAAEAFLKGFEQYKNSTKAPDSLLKLAMSLGGLGSYDEACATLGQLHTKYPEAGRSLTDRAKQEAQKFNCAA